MHRFCDRRRVRLAEITSAAFRPRFGAARLRLLQPPTSTARAESIEDGQSVAIADASLSVELGGYGIGLYRVSDESADR